MTIEYEGHHNSSDTVCSLFQYIQYIFGWEEGDGEGEGVWEGGWKKQGEFLSTWVNYTVKQRQTIYSYLLLLG